MSTHCLSFIHYLGLVGAKDGPRANTHSLLSAEASNTRGDISVKFLRKGLARSSGKLSHFFEPCTFTGNHFLNLIRPVCEAGIVHRDQTSANSCVDLMCFELLYRPKGGMFLLGTSCVL